MGALYLPSPSRHSRSAVPQFVIDIGIPRYILLLPNYSFAVFTAIEDEDEEEAREIVESGAPAEDEEAARAVTRPLVADDGRN